MRLPLRIPRWMAAVGLLGLLCLVAVVWRTAQARVDTGRVWTIGSDDTLPYHYLVKDESGE